MLFIKYKLNTQLRYLKYKSKFTTVITAINIFISNKYLYTLDDAQHNS